MGTKYKIQGNTLQNIANSIRNLTETTASLKPSQMIAAVSTSASVVDSGFIEPREYMSSTITTAMFLTEELIGGYAFWACSNLTSAAFPSCKYIDGRAFFNCASLTTVSLPTCTYIGNDAFYGCRLLSTVYLNDVDSVTVLGSTPFENTPMQSGTGKIYVPSSLYTAFYNNAGWASYKSCLMSV